MRRLLHQSISGRGQGGRIVVHAHAHALPSEFTCWRSTSKEWRAVYSHAISLELIKGHQREFIPSRLIQRIFPANASNMAPIQCDGRKPVSANSGFSMPSPVSSMEYLDHYKNGCLYYHTCNRFLYCATGFIRVAMVSPKAESAKAINIPI
ncbi:hypothetical protein [Acidovorax sp. Root568]|uniref:hypothetical protein n=1 Tax=Acidovorax sp. Root568 TaxID=1736565 RepID=UPI0012E38EA3|nr:hypothetical protein [Acidovorax sp. Root568]